MDRSKEFMRRFQLSDDTRRVRRNTLLLSSILILITHFGVSVDNITVAGISLQNIPVLWLLVGLAMLGVMLFYVYVFRDSKLNKAQSTAQDSDWTKIKAESAREAHIGTLQVYRGGEGHPQSSRRIDAGVRPYLHGCRIAAITYTTGTWLPALLVLYAVASVWIRWCPWLLAAGVICLAIIFGYAIWAGSQYSTRRVSFCEEPDEPKD